MKALCDHDGCDEPVGKNRRRWCGPEHAGRPSQELSAHDIDEVAVIRAVRGELDGIALNRHERRQAVGLLVRRGLPSHEIADRVGATVRTVRRDRAILRRAA